MEGEAGVGVEKAEGVVCSSQGCFAGLLASFDGEVPQLYILQGFDFSDGELARRVWDSVGYHGVGVEFREMSFLLSREVCVVGLRRLRGLWGSRSVVPVIDLSLTSITW